MSKQDLPLNLQPDWSRKHANLFLVEPLASASADEQARVFDDLHQVSKEFDLSPETKKYLADYRLIAGAVA